MTSVSTVQSPTAPANPTPVDSAPKPRPKTPEKTTGGEDSVHLSASAQAALLEKSGETITEIASALGTNAQTVEEYLGLTTSSTTVQIPLAQPAGHK